MSGAKPYTMDDLSRPVEWPGSPHSRERAQATVRALEEAQDLYRETEERLAKERTAHDQAEARIEELTREVERRDELLRADGYEEMRQHAAALAQRAEKAEARLREVAAALNLADDCITQGLVDEGHGCKFESWAESPDTKHAHVEVRRVLDALLKEEP